MPLNTEPAIAAGRLLRSADRDAPRSYRGAERAGQREADPAARQSHRRPGGAARRAAAGPRRASDRYHAESRVHPNDHRSTENHAQPTWLPVRLRQRVRDRGAARRAADRPELAAAMRLRPLRRAARGSPFTAPRASNERSWLYRIRPTVANWGRFAKADTGLWRTAPCAEVEIPPHPCAGTRCRSRPKACR